MLQLRRSTALVDLNATHRANNLRAVQAERRRTTPVVAVGGLGMTIVRAPRTAVGSAYHVASNLFVRAGAGYAPEGPPGYKSPPSDPGTETYENKPASSTSSTTDPTGVNKPAETTMTKPAPTTTVPTTTMPKQSVLGKVATVAIVTPFVAGPPVIGYLLFGWIGAGVGAVIAAPLALGLVAYTVMG